MTRKVYVVVKVRLVLDMDANQGVGDVVSEVDYDFTSTTDGVNIIDTEIIDHEVIDSK